MTNALALQPYHANISRFLPHLLRSGLRNLPPASLKTGLLRFSWVPFVKQRATSRADFATGHDLSYSTAFQARCVRRCVDICLIVCVIELPTLVNPPPSAERLQDVLTSVKWKEGLLTSGVLELLCSTLPWLSRSLCQEQQTEETLYDLWDLHMCVLCVGVVGRVL